MSTVAEIKIIENGIESEFSKYSDGYPEGIAYGLKRANLDSIANIIEKLGIDSNLTSGEFEYVFKFPDKTIEASEISRTEGRKLLFAGPIPDFIEKFRS